MATPELEVESDALSEEELEAQAEAEAKARREKEEMLENLATSIEGKFTMRAARRALKENQWLRAARLYFGKLAVEATPSRGETPFEKLPYSNRPDVNIVRSKCSIAIAQTVSMQFGTGNKNWDLLPSKLDTSTENVQACSLMSDEIETQLEDCKYSMHCRRAMWDRVVLGTGVMKGPLSVGKLVRSYVQLQGSTTWVPDLSVDYAPEIVRVNPWFFYPDDTTDDAANIQDSIETHPLSALELKKLMKHEGFFPEAIAETLEQKPNEYVSENWADFAKMSESNPHIYKNKYLVLEYHGPITKNQLDQLGIECSYDSLNDEYYGEVWVCQGKVIRLELEAIEASYCVPYTLCVWEKDPSSVFGFGVPLMMEDAQRVVNESWHMILDNSSISSGPQVAMQKSLIEPANGKWELTPGQIWYLTDTMATVDQAIQFFNVPNVTEQIVPIMQLAQGFSEEESGIPLITAGLNSPQVQDTATGGLMVQQASTTLLDFMSEDWDDRMTSPHIESMYAWNMQNNTKSDIKGKFSVDVRTSSQYKNKQLHIRDLEKLSVEIAQNPEMAKWINQGTLQRVRLEMMSIPSKGIIRTPEEVAAIEAEAAANAQPPVEMLELQLKARELDLKEAALAFETHQQQQREAWEHEERMSANEARFVESQARVAVSQNEKEIELLKLAQRSEETAAKILSGEKIARENNTTKAFEAGLARATKAKENELYETELELKAKTGSGV
jgi:hypothetical protein